MVFNQLIQFFAQTTLFGKILVVMSLRGVLIRHYIKERDAQEQYRNATIQGMTACGVTHQKIQHGSSERVLINQIECLESNKYVPTPPKRIALMVMVR